MVNSYFELNVVRLHVDEQEDRVSNDERIRFRSLVEAEHEMLRISKNPNEFEQEAIFCFIIREIPFGMLCINGDDDCLTERVYLPDGTKMDERLFASGSIVGIFYGRLESQIRFQMSDVVKVLDLAHKRILRGFVPLQSTRLRGSMRAICLPFVSIPRMIAILFSIVPFLNVSPMMTICRLIRMSLHYVYFLINNAYNGLSRQQRTSAALRGCYGRPICFCQRTQSPLR